MTPEKRPADEKSEGNASKKAKNYDEDEEEDRHVDTDESSQESKESSASEEDPSEEVRFLFVSLNYINKSPILFSESE